MQSHKETLFESQANLITSLASSWLLQVYVIPPLFGVQINKSQGFGIVASFTVVSFIRAYAIRRYFAGRDRRAHLAAIAAFRPRHNPPRVFGDHGRRKSKR